MDINQRIITARKEAGMTQEELAAATGKSRSAVTQWESGEVRPRHKTIAKIAEVTNKPLQWLESGIGGRGAGLMVIGAVAAGVWKEGSVTFHQYSQPVTPHPEYPAEDQRLYLVEGTSINKLAGPGEYLHAVNVQSGSITPEHEDLVIVRRMEHGMAEYTAKVLIKNGSRWLLRPSSNDSQWQEDLVLNGDEDTTIEVVDVVIARWSPIGRRGRV